jgi:hypothetical protein
VRCTGCTATLDGRSIAPDSPEWLLAGSYEVVLSAGGRTERRAVAVGAGATQEVRPALPPAVPVPAAPAPIARPAPVERDGASPAWFWAGAAVTTALVAATIASGVDTASQHGDFERNRTKSKAADGLAAETRTNVLAGLSIAAGATTAALGLFVVRF